MSSQEKKVILKLKDTMMNPDGSVAKSGNKENRSQAELAKLTEKQMMESWPPLTMGELILALINNKKNLENIEEISKLSRLLSKIKNKMVTDKGEWRIEKQELLDLQEVFQKSDVKTLNVNLHGQVYNKIQDLLLQVTN